MAAASTSTVRDVQPGAGAAKPGAAAWTMVADSVDLHELNAKSAGTGAWVLKVH